MVLEKVVQSTISALTSHSDTSTDFSKSWIGRQFEPNTVVYA